MLNEDSGISADNSLRRREGEDGKKQVYYYSIKQKPKASTPALEEDSTPPEHIEETTPPEHSPSENQKAVNEAMTQTPETHAPEHVPTPEEDAQTLERMFSGEKIECDS